MKGSMKPMAKKRCKNFSILYVFNLNRVYNVKRFRCSEQAKLYESIVHLCTHFFKLQAVYLLYALGEALWLMNSEKDFE